MRTSLYFAAALALGAATVAVSSTPARAEQQLASPLVPPKPAADPTPPEVTSAWGCVLMGSAGTAAALTANSENLLNVVAGGVVSPANPAVLYLGLAGVVFTSFCTLGQQLTPLYLYYFRSDPTPDVDVAKSTHRRLAGSYPAVEDEDVLYPWQAAR